MLLEKGFWKRAYSLGGLLDEGFWNIGILDGGYLEVGFWKRAFSRSATELE